MGKNYREQLGVYYNDFWYFVNYVLNGFIIGLYDGFTYVLAPKKNL